MKLEKVEIKKLFLDHKNPRIIEKIPLFFDSLNDDEREMYLIANLVIKYNISDLLASIMQNVEFSLKMLTIDNIISINDNERYIIKEGNRRVASLILLNRGIPYVDKIKSYFDKNKDSWLYDDNYNKFCKEIKKIRKLIEAEKFSGKIKEVDIMVYENTPENVKLVDQIIRKLHIVNKSTWDSHDKEAFDARVIIEEFNDINGASVESFTKLESIIEKYIIKFDLNESITVLKNIVLKNLLAKKIVFEFTQVNDIKNISRFYSKYLPIVDRLRQRMSKDLDIKFELTDELSPLDVTINLENDSGLLIDCEPLFIELAKYVLDNNVSHEIYKKTQTLNGDCDGKKDELLAMNEIIYRFFNNTYDIQNNSNDHNNDADDVNDIEKKHDSETCIDIDEDDTYDTHLTNAQYECNSIKFYKPFNYKNNPLYNDDFNISQYILEIIGEIHSLGRGDSYETILPSLDMYRWIISSSLRGMIQFYVDEIKERDFFDDIYIKSLCSKTGSSDTTQRIDTFESFFVDNFSGANSKNKKELFYDFYGFTDYKTHKVLENHLLKNDGGGTYLDVYKSLHTAMHGKPQQLETHTLLEAMKTITNFLFICEFFIQSYDKSKNWDFLNI